jgi:hypothetical protein
MEISTGISLNTGASISLTVTLKVLSELALPAASVAVHVTED